jgi:gliding motility-associated-like protein
MRIVQYIIIFIVFGWYFSQENVAAQTVNDSIVAPNVFTPNGDGINDFFIVKSKENQPVLLKVFNRAGVLVFSIEARLCAWDGNSLGGIQMTTGVYFYTAEVRNSSPKVAKSGFVHLLR